MDKGLFEMSDCNTASFFEDDYKGKVLVLSPAFLRPEHRNERGQLWIATGGAGCEPGEPKKKLTAVRLSDGEAAEFRRGRFFGALRPELTPDWARLKLGGKERHLYITGGKTMLYIAYGSNLHLPSMKHRCPTAKVVGGSEIKGFDLRFRGGLATVEPSENGAVPVLVWEIGDRDERALDHYEGYPSLYRKEEQPVELDGQTVNAMVYVMNGGHPYHEPGGYYYDIIREGYKSAGFDVNYLDNAVEQSVRLAMEREAEMSRQFDPQITP